ncbi:MAG: hypothetical protein INR73_28765, partial [Williamsia sp.]|nr:hypothetical protein [Williamsia sp.]
MKTKRNRLTGLHRKVANLDFTRSFFFELPADLKEIELIDYERFYQRSYDNFFCRVGNRLYFTCATSRERDRFMEAFERGATRSGYQTSRVIIPDVPTTEGDYYKPFIPGWGR